MTTDVAQTTSNEDNGDARSVEIDRTALSPKRKKTVFDGERGLSIIFAVYLVAGLLSLLFIGGVIFAITNPNFLGGYLALTWTNLIIATVLFCTKGIGVTVGFHRYLTHEAFVACRGLKIALTIAGQLAVQGAALVWVGDHRRHHKFSDKNGDPHSPYVKTVRSKRTYTGDPNDPRIGTDGFNWVKNSRGKIIYDTGDPDSHVRFGDSFWGVIHGFWHAHMGWFANRENTNIDNFAPDRKADKDIRRISDLFWLHVIAALFLIPGLLGWGLTGGTLKGFTSAIFWGGFGATVVLHHITWSVNSICHMIGERPFKTRDQSANFWPLALLSFGESWHNLHHADPSCARHGVLPGQIDISARVIWLFEKAGFATKVKWPTPGRITRKLIEANMVPERSSTFFGRLIQVLRPGYWQSVFFDRRLTAFINAGVVPDPVAYE